MNYMNKIITLAGSCLLLSTAVLADRPAMDERPTAVEPVPVAEPVPLVEEQPEADVSAVELDMQQQQNIQVHTGDALELQPGETLSIRVLDFPRRGMTMDKVQNELGSPIDISPTVGEPPITSWTYDDRIVYFEYSNVLHVVATR